MGAVVVFGACASGPGSESEPVADPPPTPVAAVNPTMPAEPAPIEAGRAPSHSGPYAPAINVRHYDVELAFDAGAPEIWGRAKIRLDRAADAPDPVAFDLTGLAVTDVRVDGIASGFRAERGLLVLDPSPVPGPHEVEISYRGTPDDGLILGTNLHGAPTVFADNWPNRARFWFPSVDHPSDKATVRFTVHAPRGWQVIANGELDAQPAPTPPAALSALGHSGAGPHDTWIWSSDVEIPSYTMVVGAADFHIRSVGLAACGRSPASRRPDGCVDVTYWVFPPDSARGREIFARAAQMVDFFTERVGPFPYEKLANVQSATRFGGMENATAIFYSERAISSGGLGEGTVSHEIAHQWFGDSVTEREWSHLWLSEGFATYFGALFFEEADGVESFRQTMRDSRQRILASPVVASQPVISRNESLYALLNDNNYPKGGWVLHMLRDVLGDDTFFRGIASYYEQFANGTALTDDLQAVMEDVSGESLGWFFDQWLRTPGFPVLDVEWTWDGAASEVEVTIEQVQDPGWATYRFPATIEVRDGSGVRRHDVDVGERQTRVRLPASVPPTEVVFDPDAWILARVR